MATRTPASNLPSTSNFSNLNSSPDYTFDNDLDTYIPLESPFDIALLPPNFGTEDAPTQDIALASALMASDRLVRQEDNNYGFFDERPKSIALSKLEKWYSEGRSMIAIASLDGRKHISFDGSHTVSADDPDLAWIAEQSFLDLMVCVGRGLGLGAVIPNLQVHHSFSFKLDLSKPYRQFTAKHVQLGFDPKGSMLWIGRLPSGEDVWLAFVTRESQEDSDTEGIDTMRPDHAGKGAVSTALSILQQRRAIMFLAKAIHEIQYLDITLDDEYPDVQDDADYRFATNVHSTV
jgi:hypothetical protein